MPQPQIPLCMRSFMIQFAVRFVREGGDFAMSTNVMPELLFRFCVFFFCFHLFFIHDTRPAIKWINRTAPATIKRGCWYREIEKCRKKKKKSPLEFDSWAMLRLLGSVRRVMIVVNLFHLWLHFIFGISFHLEFLFLFIYRLLLYLWNSMQSQQEFNF